MKNIHFDVIIAGAGPAGVTAAGALGRSGLSVALLDAGVYAGAENWSGCVYFAESLAAEDCFGTNAVEAAPFERRVVRRGTLMHNCLDVVGLELHDPAAFRNCYTVLRPVYDPYFANLAHNRGAILITETTVTSLIREKGAVRGVHTNRGPLFSDVVFIAEGDASHLVHAERLEQVERPHFLQGVKAVLSLAPGEIDKRFRLAPGEGAAYELLIRNAAIGGRTAQLNVGGFLYTNRDSLSIGYAVPLDNLRDNFRGNHDLLLEWMRGLPFLRELTEGATLSAYGTKIIRSGGLREQPVLVQDGLVVGGSSAGLGVDLPFPNFTGPASATGLYFARAVKRIAERGNAFDAKNLEREYVSPLRESVHGRNSQSLAAWPSYFGRSKVLFGRTTDIACGSAHFLARGSLTETGRFLGTQLLSYRGIRELVTDVCGLLKASGTGPVVLKTLVSAATIGRWFANFFSRTPDKNLRPVVLLHLGGREFDAAALPWPIGPFLRRLSPALSQALCHAYANDGRDIHDKFSDATATVVRGMRLTDLLLIPAFGVTMAVIAVATALQDAFRYYILKTPVERMLAGPVRHYAEEQRKARELGSIRPSATLEAKLATNTYRVGNESHIRTLWPDSPAKHTGLAQAGLWHVCPARVYAYDAPLLAGRGKVSVNWENCIKCESCWRSEPEQVFWGRHTEQRLIYRPESAALSRLLDSLRSDTSGKAANKPKLHDVPIPRLSGAGLLACQEALGALTAFGDAVSRIPLSADAARRTWPTTLGRRLSQKLTDLELVLAQAGEQDSAESLRQNRLAVEEELGHGDLFGAWYRARAIGQKLSSWQGRDFVMQSHDNGDATQIRAEEASRLFPDRIVKQWEESPLPDSWIGTLRTFVNEHQGNPADAVRGLAAVSPALALIAAHQFSALRLLTRAGLSVEPGVCAVAGNDIQIRESGGKVRVTGTLSLVPIAACSSLLIVSAGRGVLVPLSAPGITITPCPGIGFRPAGLSEIRIDGDAAGDPFPVPDNVQVPAPEFCLAIAAGAADYLCRRAMEHATSRIQFSGQMLDTEGRDGIAKLGAVKALISRSEAWRYLLETCFASPANTGRSRIEDLAAVTIAARAFGPDPGELGYDAGQVFGGFAYSEDDLLSRYYRDSAMFRYLPPAYGAATELRAALLAQPDLLKQLPATGLPHDTSEPLGKHVVRLRELVDACSSLPADADAKLAGEAAALAIGIHAVIGESERKLERGSATELESACVDLLLEQAEAAVHQAALSAGRRSFQPAPAFPLEPSGPAIMLEPDYEAFCSAPGAPHRSGDFLARPFDRSLRFVPEMQLHDTSLRRRWTDLAQWFRENCRDRLFDGMPLERKIEAIHGLPTEIIEAVKQHQWLAALVPAGYGGLGWKKAEYYILNAVAGSYGDAGIDLLIMANTSIGTTPVLLGLEDELPRVREELTPLAADAGRLGEIGSRIRKIVGSLSHPDPGRIRSEYESVMRLVDDRIRHTRVVKYLAANFLRAFYSAGVAGRRGDFAAFASELKHAETLFGLIMPDVMTALDELPRRERCHKFFLKRLAAGGVSAFALTEPTAGSDSGGVKTTAKVREVQLTQLGDGRYSFLLEEGNAATVRYLVDSDRIEFAGNRMGYRTPDGQTAEINNARGTRSYRYQGEDRIFHDIGQARTTANGFVYKFFVLTGSKMWITNGSIATQFCLYAQSAEGVTGFMVDRFSEGLVVGADERKMGQRGSPTNEIAIDNVRVPAEAVIGYEGHGQVNALETLNVGRCGLAVVSGALMRKLMVEARSRVPASPGKDILLGEAAAVLFGSESLAFHLVGLFDRPHESVRLESAIAKFLCSEDLHEFLGLLEQAYGPDGVTERYLLEKARRDARILTIYEGTNEVQRFLILRDLIGLAKNMQELRPEPGDAEAEMLSLWKNRLQQHVKNSATLLGDAVWADAMLQPAFFPLSEMAGEILRLECTLHRVAWLEQHASLLSRSDPDYAAPLLAAGRRAVERTNRRLAALHRILRQNREVIATNSYPATIRAADAALDRMAVHAAPEGAVTEPAAAGIRILAIVRPVSATAPVPRLTDKGELAEIVWTADPADRSALDGALAWKTRSGRNIAVDVLMPAEPVHERLLRSAAASADRLIRIACGVSDVPAISRAIRQLEKPAPYDLILIGDICANGDRGVGAGIAGALGRAYVMEERFNGIPAAGQNQAKAPVVLSLTAVSPAAIRNIGDLASAAFSPVDVIRPAEETPASRPVFSRPSAEKTETPIVSGAAAAAALLRQFAAAVRSSAGPDVPAPLQQERIGAGPAVFAVADPADRRSSAAATAAGRIIADRNGCPLVALVPSPRHAWPQLLGLARSRGADRALCVDTGSGTLSLPGRIRAIGMLLASDREAVIAAGPAWLDALHAAAGERSAQGLSIPVFGDIVKIEEGDREECLLFSPAYDRNLLRRGLLQKGAACISVLPDAEFASATSKNDFTAGILEWVFGAEAYQPLPAEAKPTLPQAEVIIDLGYGIGDRAGLELAEELKRTLEAIGLAPLFGATRKVTQDLKLLPLDAQIGQTGVRVDPKLVIALGVSGAPQHIDYIGPKAEILCFNKDPEAPLMQLNRTRPAPRVHPVLGDLRVTVREFIGALRQS